MPTPTYTAILTNAGLALYNAAVASGTPVQLARMALGDGGGNPTTPVATQTALVREVHRDVLLDAYVDPSDATLTIAEMAVLPTVGGWAISEVGIYTSGGVLFAVGNFPDTYKPVISDGSMRDLLIRFGMKLANSSAVTVVVDPSIVTATRQWVASNITLAALLPGGTTGQIAKKNSNADGDIGWYDPASSLNIAVNAITEDQTSPAVGPVTFTLSTCTTVGVAVYVEGIRLRSSQFTVLSSTQLSIEAGAVVAGSKVTFVQNEPNEPLNLRKIAAGYAYFLGQL